MWPMWSSTAPCHFHDLQKALSSSHRLDWPSTHTKVTQYWSFQLGKRKNNPLVDHPPCHVLQYIQTTVCYSWDLPFKHRPERYLKSFKWTLQHWFRFHCLCTLIRACTEPTQAKPKVFNASYKFGYVDYVGLHCVWISEYMLFKSILDVDINYKYALIM